jgi:hypothetical protein
MSLIVAPGRWIAKEAPPPGVQRAWWFRGENAGKSVAVLQGKYGAQCSRVQTFNYTLTMDGQAGTLVMTVLNLYAYGPGPDCTTPQPRPDPAALTSTWPVTIDSDETITLHGCPCFADDNPAYWNALDPMNPTNSWVRIW